MVLLGVSAMKNDNQVMEMHTPWRPSSSHMQAACLRLWLSHFICGSRIVYYISHLIVDGLSFLPRPTRDLVRKGGKPGSFASGLHNLPSSDRGSRERVLKYTGWDIKDTKNGGASSAGDGSLDYYCRPREV